MLKMYEKMNIKKMSETIISEMILIGILVTLLRSQHMLFSIFYKFIRIDYNKITTPLIFTRKIIILFHKIKFIKHIDYKYILTG